MEIDAPQIPITGNTNINGTIYTNANFSLTDPAIFLTDGEYYPAAARLAFTNGKRQPLVIIHFELRPFFIFRRHHELPFHSYCWA